MRGHSSTLFVRWGRQQGETSAGELHRDSMVVAYALVWIGQGTGDVGALLWPEGYLCPGLVDRPWQDLGHLLSGELGPPWRAGEDKNQQCEKLGQEGDDQPANSTRKDGKLRNPCENM